MRLMWEARQPCFCCNSSSAHCWEASHEHSPCCHHEDSLFTVTRSQPQRSCHCHFQSQTQKSMPLSLSVMDTEVHATVTESCRHRNPCHCHFQTQTQNHRFVFEFPDDLPLIKADQRRIRQVLDNLISNAIKYSPEGGTIRVGGWSEDGRVIVGFDPEKYREIFG